LLNSQPADVDVLKAIFLFERFVCDCLSDETNITTNNFATDFHNKARKECFPVIFVLGFCFDDRKYKASAGVKGLRLNVSMATCLQCLTKLMSHF